MSLPPTLAYVGLGSNLDGPASQVSRALEALTRLPLTRLLARSRLYRNPPMGPQDQPDYVNAVACLATALPAQQLLAELQGVERAQGRVRGAERWGPRTLDLDLLLYGHEIIRTPGLEVPHPGIAERPFVLLPLAEIAPDVVIPGHPAMAELLAGIECSGVVAMASPEATETPA